MSASQPTTSGNDYLSPSLTNKLYKSITRQYQHYLDQSVPQLYPRWVVLAVLFIIYGVRVYWLQGMILY